MKTGSNMPGTKTLTGAATSDDETNAASRAALSEGATARAAGWGVCGPGADMRHRQSEDGQQFAAAIGLEQPATSALQALALIGKPNVSKGTSRMVKPFTAACIRGKD